MTDAELEDIVKVGMSSLPQLTMGPPTGAPAGTALRYYYFLPLLLYGIMGVRVQLLHSTYIHTYSIFETINEQFLNCEITFACLPNSHTSIVRGLQPCVPCDPYSHANPDAGG